MESEVSDEEDQQRLREDSSEEEEVDVDEEVRKMIYLLKSQMAEYYPLPLFISCLIFIQNTY